MTIYNVNGAIKYKSLETLDGRLNFCFFCVAYFLNEHKDLKLKPGCSEFEEFEDSKIVISQ